MAIDLAIAEFEGKVTLHRANCPLVRELAAKGEAVMTLFECQGEPPRDIEQHTCLQARQPDDEQNGA